MLILIAFIVILTVFDKIPEKFYPFAVWIIAISVLYDTSLISNYLWGWDIQNEYYLANLVVNSSYWGFTWGDTYNAMLSVVMLTPIYSILTNIDLTYVLKVIYPFLFSLVPLGLYKLFKGQSNHKIGFLACFLFVSFSAFFTILPAEGREMIAELFIIALLLVIFSKTKNSSLLFVVFGLGLVVSHYSLTYFFIFILISLFIILLLFYLFKRFFSYDSNESIGNLMNLPVNLVSITIIIIFTYEWYSNIALGTAINAIKGLWVVFPNYLSSFIMKWGLNNILIVLIIILLAILALLSLTIKNREQIKKIMLNSRNSIVQYKWKYHILMVLSSALFLLFIFLVGKPSTWIVALQRYINFIIVFFTVTGLMSIFLTKNRFKVEYIAFSFVSAFLLITGIFFPLFENSFGLSRIFQITYIFLSPICIIGSIIVIKSFFKSFNMPRTRNTTLIKLVSVFLLIFMLSNTGFFSVMFNTTVPVHLNSNSDIYPHYDFQEVSSAQWLYSNRISDDIYVDEHGLPLFKKYNFLIVNVISTYNDQKNSYIFLRKFNQGNIFLIEIQRLSKEKTKVYKDMSEIINSKNEIYDNGESKSYFS